MSIFSRTRDIIAANFADLLDKAEDPAKMIRMIILEMEETVVEVRASAGTYTASEVQPETGRFSMWVNAGRIDTDDPLSKTSFSGEFSYDGKLLSLTRHWGGGMPDETKTNRR